MSDFLNQALNGAKRAYGVASDVAGSAYNAAGGAFNAVKSRLPGGSNPYSGLDNTRSANPAYGRVNNPNPEGWMKNPEVVSSNAGPKIPPANSPHWGPQQPNPSLSSAATEPVRGTPGKGLLEGAEAAAEKPGLLRRAAGAAGKLFVAGDIAAHAVDSGRGGGAIHFDPTDEALQNRGALDSALRAGVLNIGDAATGVIGTVAPGLQDAYRDAVTSYFSPTGGGAGLGTATRRDAPKTLSSLIAPATQPGADQAATTQSATKPAAPAEAPEAPQAPTRQLTPAENFAYKKAIDNGNLAAQDMPRGTGIITSSNGQGTYINSNTNPTLSKAANSTASSSDSGGTPRSHTEQVMDFIKDPNRPRMNVAAINSLMQGAIAADTNSVARSRLDLEARRFGAEADDKHYDKMMELATAKPIQQIDEHGKITNVPDDVGTDMIRHGLEQELGGDWARKLWAMPAGERGALVAKYRNGIEQTKAANKYAAGTAYGVTLDTAPKNLRQRSVGMNDLINPFQVGGMKMSDAWATALNPFLWGDTVTDVQGPIVNDKGETHIGTVQSIPTKKLMENMGGINLSTINDINASKALNKAKETK